MLTSFFDVTLIINSKDAFCSKNISIVGKISPRINSPKFKSNLPDLFFVILTPRYGTDVSSD